MSRFAVLPLVVASVLSAGSAGALAMGVANPVVAGLSDNLLGRTNSLERQILLALPESNSAIRSNFARLTRDQVLLEGIVRGQQGGIFGETFKAGGAFQAVTEGGRFSGAVEILEDVAVEIID